MSLNIIDGLKIPDSLVTEVVAWIGRRGSGKTYGATKAAEEMYRIAAQFVALDSVGVWYGLRQSAAPGSKGLEIPIFGGLRGDVPITATSGTLIADIIVDQTLTAIVDTSQFETDADKNRFVFDFVTRLFFKKKSSPSAVHIFLEESQEYAPQNIQKGEEKMLHAVQRMVRLGRNYGIGASLISQRPQDVNKKVLNQAEVVFAFQLTGPQEIDAVKYWCSEKGYGDDLRAILPKLETGHAHLWSPALLKINREVHISKKETVAAGTTPAAGLSAKRPRELAPIEIERLKQAMASTIEKAKADDPRELRRQISDLQKQLAAKASATTATVSADQIAKIRQEIIAAMVKTTSEALTTQRVNMLKVVSALPKIIAEHIKSASAFPNLPHWFADTPTPKVMATSASTSYAPAQPRVATALRDAKPRATSSGERLPEGEKKILIACAQHPDGCDRTQLTVLTGFKRSTRDAYLQRLSGKGLVEIGATIKATQPGIDALGADFEPFPHGVELQSYWLNRLPDGESKILRLLIEQHPAEVGRQDLTDATGYQRSTRDAYIQRLAAKKLVTVERAGAVKAAGGLF